MIRAFSVSHGTETINEARPPTYMMKNAVITGVSSGIGLATARSLAANGFKVYGSVRKRKTH